MAMSSAVKRASDALSANKLSHHHANSAVKNSESNSSIRGGHNGSGNKTFVNRDDLVRASVGRDKVNITSPRIVDI